MSGPASADHGGGRAIAGQAKELEVCLGDLFHTDSMEAGGSIVGDM